MNYGASAYGSAAYGGNAVGEWYTFFPFVSRAPDVLFESQAEFGGTAEFFTLVTEQSNETGEGLVYKAYTANDSNETPQLRSTFSGIGSTLIPAARFITVTAEIDGDIWSGGFFFSIRGRPGD